MQQVKHISLFQLQAQIKASLSGAFPFAVWVVAEIAEKKVNYSGHCYMELVEKDERSSLPKAKASAVIWKNNYAMLSSYFRASTGSDFSVGMSVMLKVSVSFHELYGLSFQVSDINADYTLGERAKEKEITIEKLKKDGIYDMNHSLELSEPVQNVAVISSKTAAGFQDFCNEIGLSPYQINLMLYDALMQGQAAEKSIIEALDAIVQDEHLFDAVVIIRGGGSQSDLSCFDSYTLCSVLAQFPLPIISGIGHDKDSSVLDLVSRLSLKTPTAVATFLVDNMANFDSKIIGLGEQIINTATALVQENKTLLDQRVFALTRLSTKLTQGLEIRIENLKNQLLSKARELILSQKAKIENKQTQLDGLNPERILSLGFSLIRLGGKTISDSSQLKKGDAIEITMNKGKVNAEVK